MDSKNSLTEFLAVLDARRNQLINRKGGWIIGEGVFSHGYELMGELLPNKSYFHVLMLNATGRLPEDRLCKWVEAVFITMSWPDPRIWCNTIGSYAGTNRTSVMAGTLAGLLASESKLYGPRTLIGGVKFIEKAKSLYDSGESVEAIIHSLASRSGGKLHIPGYVRPIADGDIRVSALNDYATSLGFEQGAYLQLAWQIETALKELNDQSMNLGGYISAFLADQGFSATEVFSLFPTMVSSGVTACALEERTNVASGFLPLRCVDIEYVGEPSRELPANFKRN